MSQVPSCNIPSVITPFLPPGFSRVPAHKTRQPEPSRSDPMGAHHIKITSRRGLGRISRSLTKFDQVWPKSDQVWPSRFDPTGTHHTKRTSGRSPGTRLLEFGEVWPSLTKVDQVWPRFDQGIDRIENWIRLTAPWPLDRAHRELRFSTLRVEKRTRNEGVRSKTVKIGPTLSQILLSVVDKIAYLGGTVCA